MNYKGCVVIQGGFSDFETVNELKRAFMGYQIIFSTWEDVDKSIFHPNDILILNEIPTDPGPSNFNLQKISTIAGVNAASELGWNRVIKWRSDMIPINFSKIMYLMDGELNLYLWVNSNSGYITDYVMEGECWDIVKLFSTQVIANKKLTFPEHFITLQMFRNELNFKAKLFGKKLGDGCDIFWKKRGYYLSENKNDSGMYSDTIPLNWGAYPILR